MNNIISYTDFVGKYALSVSSYAEETFVAFITQEQYDILIDLLGEELYNDFNANPATQKWVDLLNGKTYTDYNGYVRNWRGLATMLIPYIYSKHTLENYKHQVQSGVVKPKFENADILNERERKEVAYKAWNEFVKIWYEAWNFLYTNNSDYLEFEDHFQQKYFKGLVNLSQIR